jgi:hypothetical protein
LCITHGEKLVTLIKPILIFSFFFFLFSTLNGQNIEIAGGFCKNNFFDLNDKNDPHYNSSYISGSGFSAALSISHILFDSIPLKYSLRYYNFTGSIYTSASSLGSSGSTSVYGKFSRLNFDLFLLNFKIVNVIHLNFGISFNYLLKDRFSGFQKYYAMNGIYKKTLINENSGLASKLCVGPVGRVAYEIALSKKYYLLPQYEFYYGLSLEFLNYEANTKSYRQFIEIALGKIIK